MKRLTSEGIKNEYPLGCFIFMFDWDVRNSRCSRNVLPAYVKPVAYKGRWGVGSHVLYHKLDGTPLEGKHVPHQTYYVTDTEQEAREGYLKLIEEAAISRDDYVKTVVKSTEDYIQSLKSKAIKHVIK